MKPMLACDWDPQKVRFPVYMQPKIDGVRGLNFGGALLARSLKQHRNAYTTRFWTAPSMIGLDGELAAQSETHPALCRLTSSALSTKEGEPFTLWWVFDYVRPETAALPYSERLALLRARVQVLEQEDNARWQRLRVVPTFQVGSVEELEALDTEWLEAGYEGSIVRGMDGPYKFGRCTTREGYLLRIKRFVEEEFLIDSIEEGQTNLNEAVVNELGRSKRSTHQEGMVSNGQVGALLGKLMKDVHEPQTGELLFKAGDPIRVSPGCLTQVERIRYFDKPSLILGKVGKFKFFPKGTKDRPRFPQFQSLRSEEDR